MIIQWNLFTLIFKAIDEVIKNYDYCVPVIGVI